MAARTPAREAADPARFTACTDGYIGPDLRGATTAAALVLPDDDRTT
ncbi:MAG: hypothetical protein AVDCRST_MAG48-3171 [uncultured Friedmanniella sp.]|uniref:Uncharacterized protein n=1 Tax=uncultured Friedmanniella sp. TaxID=335381 RepID=A0A6J4LGQ3_9ACTN|nr:MAG: hypothetical protein AVDCRST_MAG48-3171 [uncultured Friedmanniella sp.]